MKTSGNQNTDLADPMEGGSTLDWQEIAYLLRGKSWLIGLCVLAGLFAALGYVERLPKVYRAVTVLQLEPEQRKVLGFEETQPDATKNEADVHTMIVSFQSRNLLRRLAEAEKLNEDPEFLPFGPDGKPHSIETAVGALSGMIRVDVRLGTRLLDVAVHHANPRMAQRLANAIAMQFLEQKIEQRASSAQMVIAFLVKEAEKIKAHLQKSETALQDYKEKNNAVSLEDRQDTVNSKLKALGSQLTEAKAARIRLETDNTEVQKHPGDMAKLLGIASVASHPSVAEVRQKIENVQTVIATLALRYTDKHPKMKQAKTALTEAQAALQQAVLVIPQRIKSETDRATAMEKSFADALRDQEKLALQLNRQAIAYNVLQRDVETDRALYDSILRRLKETDIAQGVEVNDILIFEPATLPGAPVDLKRWRVILIGLAAGLMAGLGTCAGIYFLDPSLRGSEQAEAATGLQVLGAIPRRPGSTLAESGSLQFNDPGSPLAESFRFLSTSLHLAARKYSGRVCLFTSALPGEGKTFCAINAAVAFAQQGGRVLIMDCDLRKPVLGKLLLGNREVPTLADYIEGKYPLADIIHPGEIENVSVIAAGDSALNPAEILTRPEFGKLLEELRELFDWVIIDSAPLMVVSDTLLFVERVELTCLVAQGCRTPLRVVMRAVESLAVASSHPTGLILNGVADWASSAGYYYSGDYTAKAYQYRKTDPAAADTDRAV